LTDQKQRLFQAAHALPDPHVLVGEAHRLDHEHDHVGVLRGGDRHAVHVLIHDAAGRFVQARRIDQHQLGVGPVDDARGCDAAWSAAWR
jgi:hypothetical protein